MYAILTDENDVHGIDIFTIMKDKVAYLSKYFRNVAKIVYMRIKGSQKS